MYTLYVHVYVCVCCVCMCLSVHVSMCVYQPRPNHPPTPTSTPTCTHQHILAPDQKVPCMVFPNNNNRIELMQEGLLDGMVYYGVPCLCIW